MVKSDCTLSHKMQILPKMPNIEGISPCSLSSREPLQFRKRLGDRVTQTLVKQGSQQRFKMILKAGKEGNHVVQGWWGVHSM